MFTYINIPEAVVPYVRMTQRGKWQARPREYLSNQQLLKWYLNQQCDTDEHEMYNRIPLRVAVRFEVTRLHKGDLDNLLKAVLDACEGIIYSNDCWIDSIITTRALAKEPNVYIAVERMDDDATVKL